MDWFRSIVRRTLSEVKTELVGKIVFIRQLNRGPTAKVAFDTSESAMAFRKAFVSKKKEDNNSFGRLHMSNVVTLATRVRVEIMIAMANQYSTESNVLFAKPYSSRPVLTINKTG